MLADFRAAWQSLRRAPALAAVATLTIALGVAANATAFAWFKGIALDPLPHVQNARALVHVKTFERRNGIVQRLGALVLGALGTVALLLAAVGLYAVTAYAVARRTREIGVRVALGATARRVAAEVLGEGGRAAAAGLAVGGALAFAAARLVRAQLYGVTPADSATYAGAALLLLAVALLATWLPARRAAQVDPTVALRDE